MEKLEPLHTESGQYIVSAVTLKSSLVVPKMLNMQLSYDPEIAPEGRKKNPSTQKLVHDC